MSTTGGSKEMDNEGGGDQAFSRSRLEDHKEKVAKKHEELPTDDKHHGKISYGHKFAQTQEIYAARQMEKQLEELARQDGALDEEADDEHDDLPSREAAGHEGDADAHRMQAAATDQREAPAAARRGVTLEEMTRGAPIGALPTASEPPPRQGLSEVMADALRYTGMIRDAVRDITTASMRLARLPVEMAVLAAQRIRPLKA